MMQPLYFFAGCFPFTEGLGMFQRQFKDQLPRSTNIVGTSCGVPYKYTDEMEARRAHRLASHHSGLYRLDPNTTTAVRLQSSSDPYLSPERIKLQSRHLKSLGLPH